MSTLRAWCLCFALLCLALGPNWACPASPPNEGSTPEVKAEIGGEKGAVESAPDARSEPTTDNSSPEPSPEPVPEPQPEPRPEPRSEPRPEPRPEPTGEKKEYTLPDPGTHTSPNLWQTKSTGTQHCTPDTAWPAGVVTRAPAYVDGTACQSTGNIFYVFKTGPNLTTFTIQLFSAGTPIEHVHLHDGDGGKFGALITPTRSTKTSGTWTVKPNHIYVLEVHLKGGGFF